MKKLFLLLALFGSVFTACEGGDGVEEENGGTPFVPEITISPEELSFPVEGGEEEVAITANFEYEVSERADWLSVEQTEVGLLVKVDKSERTESRYADIVITNKDYEIEKYVTVSQAAFEPNITIKPSVVTFTAGGGEQEVIITSNVEYEVSERASWLSVEHTEAGLIVTAEESKNTSERTAYISISNEKYSITKTIDIVQEAWVPKIELAQQSIEVEFEPAEYEVAVTSPYSWEATTKNDWIEVKTETGIAGEEVLKFSAKRNEEEKERKGTITLKNSDYNLVAELYVTQKAFVPEWTVEPESLNFAVEGGTQEVAITANFEYEYTTNADWLTIARTENGIKVTAPNYVEVDERTAEITILNEKYGLSKVVNVKQGAFVPEWTVEPESLNFAVEGGTQEVAITANFEYEYTTNADWLTIARTENGIKVTAPNYVEVDERTAEITILNEKYGLSKVVNVKQGAFVPEWTVEPESLNFAVEGGTQEVAITANFEYEYTTNADWLTIARTENGIKVTAPNYVEIEGRTSEIIISSEKYNLTKKINISQAGVSKDATNAIFYTSTNGDVVTPYETDVFGANIVSNTYKDGQGLIFFDAPVTSIGEYAFRDCTSLARVTIPDSVTSIGNDAFLRCSSLTSVTIPDSVTSIGEYAFHNCSSLTSITIPDSVTSIGYHALYNCTSLASVTISNSVTSIGDGAFSGCSSLTAFYGKFASADNRCLIVDGVLNSFAPAGLTEYTIPDSVISIGSYAFCDCTSLTSITIPDSVTSIGRYAFLRCSSLTSVTIPDSVTSIVGYTFYNCSSLTSVHISDLSAWCKIDFGSSDANPLCYGAILYLNGTEVTELTIPSNITEIKESAFNGCSSLTSVTIPDSVTSIGIKAFYKCTSLTSVTIGNSVTSIGLSAFYGCSSLTSVYCLPRTPPAICYYDYYYYEYGSFPFNSGITIYVPRSAYDSYMQYSGYSDGKVAQTNWYKYESYIEPYDF